MRGKKEGGKWGGRKKVRERTEGTGKARREVDLNKAIKKIEKRFLVRELNSFGNSQLVQSNEATKM